MSDENEKQKPEFLKQQIFARRTPHTSAQREARGRGQDKTTHSTHKIHFCCSSNEMKKHIRASAIFVSRCLPHMHAHTHPTVSPAHYLRFSSFCFILLGCAGHSRLIRYYLFSFHFSHGNETGVRIPVASETRLFFSIERKK